MKGFTKGKGKGKKFIPTTSKKGVLYKKDLQKNVSKVAGSNDDLMRSKHTMGNAKELWNNSNDEKRERLIRTAYADKDFPSPLIDSNTGDQIGSLTGQDQVNDLVSIHSVTTNFDDLPPMVKSKLDNLPYWHREKQSLDDNEAEENKKDIAKVKHILSSGTKDGVSIKLLRGLLKIEDDDY